MVLGMLLTAMQKSKGQLAISANQKQEYLLMITEEPSESAKSIKIVGDVFIQSINKNSSSTSAKCLIYLAKDSLAKMLNYGDHLQINTRLSGINPPQNPHEFNYRKYLKNRNINHQAYLNKDAWQIIDHKQANPIKYYALKIRRHFLNTLTDSNLSESEFAVAAAILLGQDEILDDETRQDYAGAGAMHVLCVSGLHVGIIFLAFNLILSFLKKKGTQKMIKTMLLILLIWSYALITGFSPSVLRATVMLSFIIVGEAFGKKGNIYNSIATSAFLLLLINPLMIMEVGFQLSYAAVIGIVSLYPQIKKQLYHPNRIIDKTLSILIVSVAAQLGTFPLAIISINSRFIFYLPI
jgi:competence protein ComEC